MKKIITLSLLILSVANIVAQDKTGYEKYGKTLNMGIGIGYYGNVNHSLPVATINYEFDVAKNFTLAPFAGIYSYQNYYYWGNPSKPKWDPSYRQYSYRETVVPIGVKGSYYFDQLLKAGSKWDFYAAGSLGFVIRNVVWEDNYSGDRNAYQSSSPIYLDVHVGTEYHINQKMGLFLDLSTGVSTFGLAVHF
jgi:phospholipase C